MFQFSENEAWLIRTVHAHLGGTPADWSKKQIEDQTSSFINWSNWISRHESVFMGAKSLIEQFLAGWAADQHDYGTKWPPFMVFDKWYKKTTNRHVEAETKRGNCPYCHGSGVVLLLMIKTDDQKSTVYRRGGTVTGKPYRSWRNTTPCQCTAGDAIAERWHVTPDKRRKLFACRYDSLTALMDDAVAICGGVPHDQRQAKSAGGKSQTSARPAAEVDAPEAVSVAARAAEDAQMPDLDDAPADSRGEDSQGEEDGEGFVW